jgi:Inositol monophosphatase family
MASGAAQSHAPADYSEFVTLAHELAASAGGVTTSYFRYHPYYVNWELCMLRWPTSRGASVSADIRISDAASLCCVLTLAHREGCRSKLIIDSKADESPVTKADREAEAAMRRLLAERVPDHAVFGAMPHHLPLNAWFMVWCRWHAEMLAGKIICTRIRLSMTGEEDGMGGGSNSRFLWVLDPIDGTKSFITGDRDH